MTGFSFDPDCVFVQGPVPSSLAEECRRRFNADHNVGAQLVFEGQVRADSIDPGTNAAGTVAGIEYTAHESMARRAFFTIVERLTAGADLVDLEIRHSLGYVPAGGVSLLIAVATGHRAEAYALSRELLEAIKKEVPIYGREITTGEDARWKVNR
jgi:molybdopterin synthase catalytic subunit